MALQLRRPWLESSLPWKPQILHHLYHDFVADSSFVMFIDLVLHLLTYRRIHGLFLFFIHNCLPQKIWEVHTEIPSNINLHVEKCTCISPCKLHFYCNLGLPFRSPDLIPKTCFTYPWSAKMYYILHTTMTFSLYEGLSNRMYIHRIGVLLQSFTPSKWLLIDTYSCSKYTMLACLCNEYSLARVSVAALLLPTPHLHIPPLQRAKLEPWSHLWMKGWNLYQYLYHPFLKTCGGLSFCMIMERMG